MEWYWAWYVLGHDTNTMKTPSQICAASVWIWKGGFKKRILGTCFQNFHQTSLERLCTWIRTGQSPIYDACLWGCLIFSHSLCLDGWTILWELIPQPTLKNLQHTPCFKNSTPLGLTKGLGSWTQETSGAKLSPWQPDQPVPSIWHQHDFHNLHALPLKCWLVMEPLAPTRCSPSKELWCFQDNHPFFWQLDHLCPLCSLLPRHDHSPGVRSSGDEYPNSEEELYQLRHMSK